MKKLIIAVVGRSGAGKDILTTQISHKMNIPVVCSFTDRPMRPTEKEGREHQFLSIAEMDILTKNHDNLMAYTKIGDTGYRYCVTKDYIDNLPGNMVFYIIDPNGIEYLKKNCPEYDLRVISVQTCYSIRKQRAVRRNGEPTAFLKRVEDEKEQFDSFEQPDKGLYDYLVRNDTEFTDALAQFEEICNEIIKEQEAFLTEEKES